MRYGRIIAGCCWALSLVWLVPAQAENAPQQMLVHYMPWYASKPVSGQWGWHWTMDRFNPDKVKENGRREVASHDYPLIGPYDSNDADALECHVLLMKFAGIDGVIVDWYGIEDFRDYADIHRNSKHLIQHVRRAGLTFALCYEDQTVKHMLAGKVLKPAEDVAHGTQVMQWLEENWFSNKAYLKQDGRPVLLVFGPQHFAKAQWTQMMSGLKQRPRLYALPHLSRQSGADGAFGWPPVHGGREIAPQVWRDYLRDLYARGEQGESVIAAVFPKFHDIYEQAGLHESYGFLDDRDGKTFTETLRLASKSNARLVQIATWNDYGEGTMIEPTRAHGYRYLETLQQHKQAQSGKAFPFAPADLRLPIMLYELRKQRAGEKAVAKKLDRVSELLFSAKCSQARELLREYRTDDAR